MNRIYEDNKNYYERNAAIYENTSWYFLNKYKDGTLQEEINKCINSINKDHISVLEIGPGTGYLLGKLLAFKKVSFDYLGIEHSLEMTKILTNRYKSGPNKIEIINASASAEYLIDNFSNKRFDFIIGSSILHHLPDYTEFIQYLPNLLNKNGIIYFVREPIHKDECSRAKIYQIIFNNIYEGLNAIFLRPAIKNILWPNKIKQEIAINVALHMFHDGVSIKPFLNICKTDCNLIIFRKYNRRVSTLLSFLENKWFKWTRKDIFGNTLFAIGVQKIK